MVAVVVFVFFFAFSACIVLNFIIKNKKDHQGMQYGVPKAKKWNIKDLKSY